MLGDLPGGADLAEDLALAEHGGIEPGGDLEQVGDRRGVVLAVEVRRELVDAEVTELAQQVANVAVGAVEQLGDDVHLGAVAGGEDDRLADVVALGQTGDGLGEVVGRDRDALEQRQRTTAVVDADDEDGHSIPAYAVAPRRGSPGTARSPGAGAAVARRCS